LQQVPGLRRHQDEDFSRQYFECDLL
jgi:hypothetical protein